MKYKTACLKKTALACVVIICCAFLVANPAEAPAADSGRFFQETEHHRRSIVRLHVLAHSNHPEDQQYKFQVVEHVRLLLGETAIPVEDDYLKQLAQNLPAIRENLRNCAGLEPAGMPASVDLTRELFPMRVYGRSVYPAGEYYALKVVIGEGKGENWWCLLFPSMCLPLAGKDDPPLQEAASAEMQGRLHQEEKQTGKSNRWSFAVWDWLSGLLNKN